VRCLAEGFGVAGQSAAKRFQKLGHGRSRNARSLVGAAPGHPVMRGRLDAAYALTPLVSEALWSVSWDQGTIRLLVGWSSNIARKQP
jgi:hypothetical protein